MHNFVEHFSGSFSRFWNRLSGWKKALIISAIVFLILLILLAGWALVNIRAMKEVYAESLAAKKSFEFAQTELAAQQFDRAEKNLQEAHEHFVIANDKFARFKVYKFFPGVRPQIIAIDNVLQAGLSLSSGLQTLTHVGGEVNAVIQDKDASFDDISIEQKREVLKTLSESTSQLQAVKADIELAVVAIEDIPNDGLLKPVSEAVQPIKQQLPILETLITQALPAAESLPQILGYPEEKTYLFLLQNNRELRPAGGFIGTYGIIKLDAGEIKQFDTENIYVLDIAGQGKVTEASPGPIAQHTSTKQWYMRDSNWSPDFPTSAQKAEQKYHEEGGPEENLEGVIAITPTFIESLLRLTGPITVDGVTFTDENLFEELQYQVEFAYDKKHIDDLDRKDIIAHLSTELMNRLMGMPRSQFGDLWQTFVDNVDEKQIQIYVDDEITQSLVLEQNWGGEMKNYENSDFLMVVDANLAALKTDNVMERSLDYHVSKEGDSYMGEAQMHYKNTGTFSHFYTRYRTYTRMYLPYGAELVESSGFLTNDVKVNHGVPTDPEVTEESFTRPDGTEVKYTVVGGFTAIEPGEEGTLRIKYKLPESVTETIKDQEYRLYIQKQAGTRQHGLHFSFDVGEKIVEGAPLDLSPQISDNSMSVDTNLRTDREFMIRLK